MKASRSFQIRKLSSENIKYAETSLDEVWVYTDRWGEKNPQIPDYIRLLLTCTVMVRTYQRLFQCFQETSKVLYFPALGYCSSSQQPPDPHPNSCFRSCFLQGESLCFYPRNMTVGEFCIDIVRGI